MKRDIMMNNGITKQVVSTSGGQNLDKKVGEMIDLHSKWVRFGALAMAVLMIFGLVASALFTMIN